MKLLATILNFRRLLRTGQLVGCALLLVLLSFTSFSQSFKRQFKDAKHLFEDEKYSEAMDGFKPLIAYDKENPYSEYASYYYGLSAVKLGFATVAKDIFIQTRKLYPTWDRIDDVSYLLAKLYFEQREYFQAMLILKEIRDLQVAVDVSNMKRHYLRQIRDAETLRMMLEEYPAEAEAARALVKAISLQPPPERDMQLFDSLVIKFGFNKKDYITDTVLVSTKKNRYTISLLLPFLANTLDPSPVKKRNQFVLDLYEGMKMAVDTLAVQNINLDLYAYDTDRNADVTRKVLELEELKTTDLLVGPLFQEQSRIVLEFSEMNKINVINPVSNNSEFMGKDPYAMLYQPSHETLGTRSAEWVATAMKNKNCMVYFGDTPKDSVKAFSFIKKALELGVNIVNAEEVNRETSAKIYPALATGTEFDEWKNPTEFSLKKDSIGAIYVATDDPVIYSKVISGVEARGDSIIIIGNENWINAENASSDYRTYERLHIMLEAPNYTSVTDPVYLDFRRKYIRRHGILPSDYARLGYEFIHFIGHALQKYGVYFQSGLSQELEMPGLVRSRYDFKNARDNQRVPFVYFHGGELVVVNK